MEATPFSNAAVVAAVGGQRNPRTDLRTADGAQVRAPHGDGQGGPGDPDSGAAHAELAPGDPLDRVEETLARIAQAAAETVFRGEASVVSFQQGLAGQPYLIEAGEAVVDGAAEPLGQRTYGDARPRAVLVGQRGQEEKDALVLAVDQEPCRHDSALGAADQTGVGHELPGARCGGVQDELIGGAVQFACGLQGRRIVAVVQLGAQERSCALHRGELGQLAALAVVMVQQAAQEQVVVDAGQRAERSVHHPRPLVKACQQLRIAGQRRRVVDRLVDEPQPLVGQRHAFFRGEPRPVSELLVPDEIPPGSVQSATFVCVEQLVRQLADDRPVLDGFRGSGGAGSLALHGQQGHNPLRMWGL